MGETAERRETMLVRALVELADNLVDDFDVVDLLTVLARRSVEVLDVAAAGVMLLAPGGALRVMASSSEAMRVLELFEIQAQEGPCLDCISTGARTVNNLLSTTGALWPRFTVEASNAGFTTVHAMPMRSRGSVIGALNLFGTDPRGIAPRDVELAQAFADVATITVLQHRAAAETRVLNDQLQHALTSRIVIEQAKGIVAQHTGLGMEAAFDLLRSHARAANRRLADVAEALTTGDLDPRTLTP